MAAGPKGLFSLYAVFGVTLGGSPRTVISSSVPSTRWPQPVQERHWSFGLHLHFCCCQNAIIASAGICYPFDTVRRRLQMQAEKPVEQHIYKGTTDCLKKIAAEEGIADGLYKGFFVNALRSVGGALVLVLYDRAKTYLGISGKRQRMNACGLAFLSFFQSPRTTGGRNFYLLQLCVACRRQFLHVCSCTQTLGVTTLRELQETTSLEGSPCDKHGKDVVNWFYCSVAVMGALPLFCPSCPLSRESSHVVAVLTGWSLTCRLLFSLNMRLSVAVHPMARPLSSSIPSGEHHCDGSKAC